MVLLSAYKIASIKVSEHLLLICLSILSRNYIRLTSPKLKYYATTSNDFK